MFYTLTSDTLYGIRPSGRALSPELQVPSTTSKKQFLIYQLEERAKAISQVSHASQVKLRRRMQHGPASHAVHSHTHTALSYSHHCQCTVTYLQLLLDPPDLFRISLKK